MTRAQILVLAVLAVLVCIVFGIAAAVIRAQLVTSPDAAVADEPGLDLTAALPPTATWTPIPTSTLSPTPAETSPPTATNTRVVPDTPTPTETGTPTVTPTATNTPTVTPARAGGGGGSPGVPRPAPTPTSRYPLIVAEGPISYTTKNYMFVVLAKVSSGNTLLPGYRIAGTHTPTGAHIESDPSCATLCKGSGPLGVWPVWQGNVAFEAFFFDTGTWSLVILDPQGRQASEVLNIEINREKRLWYYYRFNR
jgi:hypothetical protein